MPHNLGNIITSGPWEVNFTRPGYHTKNWVGMAVISTPAKEWQILDSNGETLPIPSGTIIEEVSLRIMDDLLGTSGSGLKVAASVTDTAPYVVKSPNAGADNVIIDQLSGPGSQTIPATPYNVTAGFIPKLFYHTNDTAPAGNLQAFKTSGGNSLSPNSPKPRPVKVLVRVIWSIKDGGPEISDDIRPCKEHARILQGLQY